jgi:hypothetical protein
MARLGKQGALDLGSACHDFTPVPYRASLPSPRPFDTTHHPRDIHKLTPPIGAPVVMYKQATQRTTEVLSMPPKWLGMYSDFITKNSSAVSQIESALRSLTYIIPGAHLRKLSH